MADDSGVDEGDVLQPAVARRSATRPGTRLVLHGKYEARNRFRVQGHAPTAEAAGRRRARSPTTRPPRACPRPQILALVRAHAGRARRRARAAAGARCASRERLPDRAARARRGALPRRDGEQAARPPPAGLRGAAARAARAAAPPAPAPRAARRAPVLDGERELTARWLAEMLPFALTGDQQRGARRDRRATSPQPRPMQRLLMGEVGLGQDRGRAVRAAAGGRARATRAALMAPTETLAEQHFATIQALMPGEAVPVGLLTGSTPGAPARRPARQARERRAVADRRHPRADRGAGRVRAARRSPSSTSSTASASRQRAALDAKARRRRERRTCCT